MVEQSREVGIGSASQWAHQLSFLKQDAMTITRW
jgi:hypothetical protein